MISSMTQSGRAESVLAVADDRVRSQRSAFGTLLRFVRAKPLGAVTGLIILLVVLAAVFAPLLAPYDPTQTSLIDSLRPPDREHLMGTDRNGRDLFSRIIYGAR